MRSLALLLVILLPSIAIAEGLDCLNGTAGLLVRWDGDWQKDLVDTDVLYRIENVQRRIGVGNQPEVHLTLSASEPAKLKRREAVMRLEHAAELFCRRIVTSAVSHEAGMVTKVQGGARRFIEPVGAEKKIEDAELALLSFRTRIEGKWVPARPAPGEKLARCMTDYGDYACSGSVLKRLVAEKDDARVPRLLRRTPHPFIRFTSSGWVRDDPRDLGEETPLSVCEVGERRFTCLTSEKERYGNLLKRLAETVAGAKSS